MTALTDLRAKVAEGGNYAPIGMDQLAATAFPPENAYGKCTFHHVSRAFHGSLDAAKALHEAVLPDKGWHVEWVAKYPALAFKPAAWCASVGWGSRHAAYSTDPARAWLLAILDALIAKEASDG